jgi:FtsH-binding integral membrane protein
MEPGVNPARNAEVTGGVVLPSLMAVACGVYLLVAIDIQSSNGWILTILGVLSLFSVMASPRWPSVTLVQPVLGWYTFALLGCLGLGLTISEAAGFRAFVTSVFWLLFGLYTLNRSSRYRRMLHPIRNESSIS